jgi:hypothetical protein
MDVDLELDAWRSRWQSEAGVPPDLRQRVSRETRRMWRAVLTQIAVYCGVPVGVDCFRVGRQVLAQLAAEQAGKDVKG